MKKFIKYATWFLIAGAIISLGLCYLIIPERTKAAMDIVIEYANKPLGIVCGTTITLGAIVGIVIKVIYDRHKTSVKDIVKEGKEFAEQQKQQAKEYYELAKQEKEQVKEILSCYDQEIDKIVEQVAVVCETSPNAKIKALADQIRNGACEFKQEIKEKLESSENELVSALDKADKVKELEDKVAELTEKLERLLEEYEREETTND